MKLPLWPRSGRVESCPDRCHGIAGYAAWLPDENDVDGWRDDPGVIFGSAGIALAHLAAATPLEPAWNRLMLADI